MIVNNTWARVGRCEALSSARCGLTSGSRRQTRFGGLRLDLGVRQRPTIVPIAVPDSAATFFDHEFWINFWSILSPISWLV